MRERAHRNTADPYDQRQKRASVRMRPHTKTGKRELPSVGERKGFFGGRRRTHGGRRHGHRQHEKRIRQDLYRNGTIIGGSSLQRSKQYIIFYMPKAYSTSDTGG